MAYERKYPDSDRFQYCKPHQEGPKTFKVGSVVRATFGDMLPLLLDGTVKEMPMYTLCRVDPTAAGGCVPPETSTEKTDTENTQAGEKAGNNKHSKK